MLYFVSFLIIFILFFPVICEDSQSLLERLLLGIIWFIVLGTGYTMMISLSSFIILVLCELLLTVTDAGYSQEYYLIRCSLQLVSATVASCHYLYYIVSLASKDKS